MNITEVLTDTKLQLGDNYKVETNDATLLKIIKRVVIQAAEISNRNIDITADKDSNLLLLSPEIIDASCIAYQNRGVEGSKSKSELGESNTFVDYTEKLRNDIIKNSKRIVG